MSATWKLDEGPTGEPLTADEAKAHLRGVTTDDDTLVAMRLTAARRQIEERTSRAFLEQSWLLQLDEFPCGEIRLPRPPLISVESIVYVDAGGELQELDAAEYVIDDVSEPARIVPAYGRTWPTARCQPGAVAISFTCGYGEASDVPEDLKAAICLALGDLNEHHEETVLGVSTATRRAIAALCAPYEVIYTP